jgi:hypothetical protein
MATMLQQLQEALNRLPVAFYSQLANGARQGAAFNGFRKVKDSRNLRP